ncbi:hypothetical protein [Actinokineospora inagensis]|uniref:hypothetical protein n=1 Tax=Actinokineospora inagensis TaxID=103730 RepID=UPI0003FD1C87|nr:hypothetical protein [Actinokineospora inagensis]
MSSAGPRSHVEALLRGCCGEDVSVKQLERDHGLKPGAIANYLKPSRDPNIPALAILERFATVTGASPNVVLNAFILDAGLGSPDLSDAEQELLARFRRLDKLDQSRLLAIMGSLESVANTHRHHVSTVADQV